MEYIEKAKYELLLALKNNESENIISVLKQYYNDMVNIVCMSSNIDKKYIYENHAKYILMKSDKIYFFSCKDKMINFYHIHIKPDDNISIIKLDKMNPEDLSYHCIFQNINDQDNSALK